MLASAFPADLDEAADAGLLSSPASGRSASHRHQRGSSIDSAHSSSQLLSAHFKDGNKPWWAFGSSQPDTSGRGFGPAWQPDNSVLLCQNCGLKFDMWWNRKHHCRNCGRIFCQACSSRSMMLPVEFSVREPQRCCDECAAELEPIQDELIRTFSNQTRVIEVDAAKPYINPVSFSLTAELQKAAASLDRIMARGNTPVELDRTLPVELIRSAKGLAFLTVIKGGFLVSAKVGTGLVVIRRPDGSWSAPSAIGTMGIGWGAQIGGEIADFVGVLMTDDAVEAFSGGGQVAVGAEVGISVGPLGRDGSATLNFAERGPAAVYSYTTSKGLFAGVSLEGAVIKTRDDVNLRFYGREMTPEEILTSVPQPLAATCLYKAIDRITTQ